MVQGNDYGRKISSLRYFRISTFVLLIITEGFVFLKDLLTDILDQTLFYASCILGACHADELAMLFKLEGMYDVGTAHKDYEMSKKLVKLWVSFSTGMEPMKFQGTEWEPLQKDKKELKYLLLDKKSEIISQPDKDRIDFWRNIYPSLTKSVN